MADATYAIPHCLGGEISKFAQGRFDRPEYRTSLNVCFNAFPGEIGPWMRRPGTQYGGHARGGGKGRVIEFDFEQSNAITLEFTDGFLRFRNGPTLIVTNDTQPVVSISTANPAVVQTKGATNWATGNTLIFSSPSAPLLENRQFIATAIDTSDFSLTDALTGATIDGSTLGPLAAGATVSRVQELTTLYTGGLWSGIRAVQAETTDILLTAGNAPQALTVTTLPSTGINPVFSLEAAVFNDGPYLDPFINGVQANPNGVSGIISITLAFPAYSPTTAYAANSFVTFSSVNYISLQDQNVGNEPDTSPAFWAPTPAGAAIGTNGFQGSDVGRLIRLYSEPALWNTTSSYTAGVVVAYNPSGAPGAATYWQALTSNTARPPGADISNWQLVPQGAALWSWGKVVSLSNVVPRNPAGSTNFGGMTLNSGLAAAFNGVFSQNAGASAMQLATGGFVQPQTGVEILAAIGKNFGSSPQQIQQATVYPSSDLGFAFGGFTDFFGNKPLFTPIITLVLRGNNLAPTSPGDGTELGTAGPTFNTTSNITIVSADQVTAWQYVWIEVIANGLVGALGAQSWSLEAIVGQISLFNPTGTGTGDGVNVEILGPSLLYAEPILTWRLGAFTSNAQPTCGTYAEGRLWLGGAIANRFDACVSNGIVGNTVNFSPTDQYGVVAASNAISETLNSDSVNQITWMEPDLQGIIMGTQAGEYLVVAPTSGPIAPANIAARRVTRIGCANVEPRRTEHTTVFVQRYGRKLMEYFPDVYSGKFSAPNIADKAEHVITNGIAEIAYVSAVAPIIWGRDGLGALFGVSYKRDTLTTSQGPTFNAWHRHALGSGRVVESICSGPSVGGDLDSVTMVTNDPATNIRHVEVLTDAMGELTPLSEAWYLDNAVVPASTSSSDAPVAGAPYGGLTVNGLWHLNGKTVQAFAGGLDCGDRGAGTMGFTDFVVTNGSIFIPYGDGEIAGSGRGLFTEAFAASNPLVVGFTYDSDGQLVRQIMPADTGARNGPALGKKRRNHRVAVLLNNALGICFGTSFSKMVPAAFKLDDDTTNIPPLTTFSGIYAAEIKDDYSYDGMVCWRLSRPFPAIVVAISGNLATQDQ